jgi:hypothetical protein
MIIITVFFIWCPGEYTGTYSDAVAFKLHYIRLHIQGQHLGILTSSERELDEAAPTSYVFTTQKNGHHTGNVVLGLIYDP